LGSLLIALLYWGKKKKKEKEKGGEDRIGKGRGGE